ncbi:class I SAM-dependent methyltransferase [Nocardia uniformis]|uniref:Class I SAM-dependent methyltransferase n=1 Tax=Nocardia uniformis TaxID=53432 RepID=A0A849BTV2_9NOCA|nr:class I SAM-dependent methyltransferase [Nocardia uniformis]NNH69574.1 class I SAM-dependent methyltransferase [Nocardia uniformis]
MSTVSWTENHTDAAASEYSARWHSENGTPAPTRITVADDRTKADNAYRLCCEGTALLWRGDFQNARQLLAALGRRLDRKTPAPVDDPAELFRQYRRSRGHRARVLGRVLVVLEDDYSLALRRAPEVRLACREAYGPAQGTTVVALTELLGVIGAHQWRRQGVAIPYLDASIHPHYGVFSPVRGEYIDLVASAPLPPRTRMAFDLGTGTGVLAAVLARRGISRILATDANLRALDCARATVRDLRLTEQIDVVGPALYPEGRADLIVCNPPWLPARPTSDLEQGVYDPDSAMLREFLTGLPAHLEAGGEGWLIVSDLAERLGLRGPDELPALIESAGLRVIDKLDTNPRHRRAKETSDPLHAARSAEVTSLWRLVRHQ